MSELLIHASSMRSSAASMVEEGISEGLIPFTFRRPIRGFEGLLNEDGDIDYLGEIANGGD